MNAPLPAAVDWPLATHQVLSRHGVGVVGYVPDAGHKRLIELCQADKAMRAVAVNAGVRYVSLYAAICPPERLGCYHTVGNGVPMQFDYGHFTAEGSIVTVERVLERLREGGEELVLPGPRPLN